MKKASKSNSTNDKLKRALVRKSSKFSSDKGAVGFKWGKFHKFCRGSGKER
jgi:hypothetical protein